MTQTLNRDLIPEMAQLLYKEARLLDERDYHAWLDLWTEDCRYRVPMRRTVAVRPGQPTPRVEDELTGEAPWVDDDKLLMTGRVMRLDSGKAWSENPPARTRRFVSNIEIEAGDGPDNYRVFSNMAQFRSRRDKEEKWFVCQRRDIVARVGDVLRFRERIVILDSDVLLASYGTFL